MEKAGSREEDFAQRERNNGTNMLKKLKKQDKAAIVLLLAAAVCFLLKCLVTSEISLEDESNYIATAFRFYKGDAILADDWSPWQLSGFVILPFIYLYMLVGGTTEGIVLYFRILYVLFKLTVTLYAVYRLRKAGEHGRYVYLGTAFFFCFTPFNIDSLSYNTISMAMVLLIGIILLTESRKGADYFLCGLFLAFAVLSSPFFVLCYLLWGASCGVYCMVMRGKEKRISALTGKNFGMVTLGAASLAAVFLIFALSRAGIREMAVNLPYIVKEPDHDMTEGNAAVNLLAKVWLVVKIFLREYIFVTLLNGIYIITIVILKRRKKEAFLMPGAVLCLILSCAWIILRQTTFMQNAFFIPFVWFAAEEVLIGKKIKASELLSLTAALIYAVCMAMGTNTGMFATSATFCVIAVLSVVIMGRRLGEIPTEEAAAGGTKKTECLLCGGIALLLCCTFVMRLLIVWLDVFRFDEFSCYISRGPLKGTFAQEAVYEKYENILNVMDMAEYGEEDILLCGTPTPTAYLYGNMQFGTIGTYFFSMDYERLEEYYELHPQKFPTVVYYEVLKNGDKKSDFYNGLQEDYEIQLVGESMIAKKR